MTSNNEYFTPEQVDEQIERLRQQSTGHEQTNEVQLVNMLQRHYQVSLVEEDRIALAHAQQRVLENLDNQSILDYEPQFVNVRATRPVAHPKRAHLTRLLSGLAAVLVVGALLVSWFTVTQMAKTSLTSPAAARQSNLYTIHSSIAYCIDGSTGKVVWQHPVPTRKLTDFNHGGSAQLLVANSTVYAMLDFDIYALDSSTGNQRWHIANHGQKEYFYMAVDRMRLYLFSLDNTFSAFDATSGIQLWHNTTFTTENGYGFSVLNGNLYTQTSDSNGEQKLYALDGATGKVRWSYPLVEASLLTPPLATNGVVYFSSGGILSAVKEQNGDKIWETRIPNVSELESLYVANDKLYIRGLSMGFFTLNNATTYALDVRNGQRLWTSDPDFKAFHLPITDGVLLSEHQHDGSYGIAGLDARTGKAVWQAPFRCNAVIPNPEALRELNPSCSVSWSEVINGTLYLLESDIQPPNNNRIAQMIYTLESFNPRTGQLLSKHALESGQNNPRVIGTSNGILYTTIGIPREANTIPYDDVVFVTYHLNDGTQAWRHAMPPFPAPQGANTSPNTSGAALFP